MLDLDKLDPDWKFAQSHGKACSPGIATPQLQNSAIIKLNDERVSKHSFCHCCLNIINKQPIPLCENTKELDFLGFGIPLYFVFNKYNIILLILQITSYSLLSLYWAVQANHDLCNEGIRRELPGGYHGVCTSWLIRFVRTQEEVTNPEMILRICSFLIHLLGLIYTRDTINKTRNYYHERSTMLSHYSVFMQNIPREPDTESKIRKFLKEGFKDNQFEAKDVVLFNILEDYLHIRDEKRHLLAKKKKLLHLENNHERESSLTEIDNQIQEKEEEMSREYEKQNKMIEQDTVICEKAIIVLNSQQIRTELLREFKNLEEYEIIQYFGNDGIKIEMDVAPEPREIMWQNINYPNKQRVLRLIVGWTLTIASIVIITGIFYGILHAKGVAVEHSIQKASTSQDTQQIHALQRANLAGTLLIMIAVTFFNKFIFSFILHHFTDIEMHRTGGEYEFSFGLKYTLGLFFTTALMTLFVEDFSFHNIYSEQYGVVEEESIMFFLNAYFIPLIWVVHPWQIVHLLKRKYYYGRKDITQRQANDLMEDSKYSVGKKYAETTESVWFTYFYSSLIPGGTVLMLIGFCFFYWVDKVVVLRRSSINPNVNAQLSIHSMKLVEVSLILRCVGEIIFDVQLRKGGTTWGSVICLIIGVIYLLLPVDDLLNLFHEQKFKPEQRFYDEVKDTFVQNYRNMHPLFLRERYEKINQVQLITNENMTNRFDFHPAREFPIANLHNQLQSSRSESVAVNYTQDFVEGLKNNNIRDYKVEKNVESCVSMNNFQ